MHRRGGGATCGKSAARTSALTGLDERLPIYPLSAKKYAIDALRVIDICERRRIEDDESSIGTHPESHVQTLLCQGNRAESARSARISGYRALTI